MERFRAGAVAHLPQKKPENLFVRYKIERDGVDTIAQTRGRRSIVENMTEVPAASRTFNFRARHTVRFVRFFQNELPLVRLIERRPTRSGIEFGLGGKKWQTTAPAHINTLGMVVPQVAAERRFRTFFPQNFVFKRLKTGSPVIVGKLNGTQAPALLVLGRYEQGVGATAG